MKKETDFEQLRRQSELERIDGSYIFREIRGLLNFENGLGLTIKNMLISPGKTVRGYLFKDRKKTAKPLIFLILTAAIFVLITKVFGIYYSFVSIEKFDIQLSDNLSLQDKIRAKEVGKWLNKNIGYAQLIMGFFIGLWIKLLFYRWRINLYEVLILLSFVFGEGLLILSLFFLMTSLFNVSLLGMLGIAFYLIYLISAITQFFGGRQILNYAKTLLAVLLGTCTYLGGQVLVSYLLNFL